MVGPNRYLCHMKASNDFKSSLNFWGSQIFTKTQKHLWAPVGIVWNHLKPLHAVQIAVRTQHLALKEQLVHNFLFFSLFFIESKLRLLPSLNRLWFGLSPTENLLLKIVGALLNSIKTKVLPPFPSKISSDLMLEIIKSWWRIPLDWTKWKWGWTFYLRLPFQKVKFFVCFFQKSISKCVVFILENISIL